MKTPSSLRMTRRDMCYFIGNRAAKLTPPQANKAWRILAHCLLDDLSGRDIPKFIDVLAAIRIATIDAKKKK